MLYIANITSMVRFISPIYIYYLLLMFPCLNRFTAQRIINDTVEAPFEIPGAITVCKKNLRGKPISESNIGFLLEFER